MVKYIVIAAVMALMVQPASVATVVGLPTAVTASVTAAMAATVVFRTSLLFFSMSRSKAETVTSEASVFVALNA